MHNDSMIACRDDEQHGGITDSQVSTIRETEPPQNVSIDIEVQQVYTLQTGIENMQQIRIVTNLPNTDTDTTMSFAVHVRNHKDSNSDTDYRLQTSRNPQDYDKFNSLPETLKEIYRLTDCVEM